MHTPNEIVGKVGVVLDVHPAGLFEYTVEIDGRMYALTLDEAEEVP